jgi:hypothetical protein
MSGATRIEVARSGNAVAYIEPSQSLDENGFAVDDWYWCVLVDGGIYADGDGESMEGAKRKALGNYREAGA